jgi:F-type H+-transporting ATPase subunit b
MDISTLLMVAEEGGRVHEVARTFGVNWTHLIAQMISFAIVCAVLYKFAYRRILAMLEERRRQIELGITQAEQIKAELARIELQRQEVLAQANTQAAKFIEDGRTAAARLQEQKRKEAVAAAQEIVNRGREAAAREREQILAELKREVGQLAVQAAMQVSGKILTPEDQRRLAEETTREVAGPR